MRTHTKIHRNLVEAVVKTLGEIFINQRYADKAIEYTLQSNKKWGGRDRGFIAENTYEIVRWWRLIQEMGGITEVTPSSLWLTFGVWWTYKGEQLPDWPEFNTIHPNALKAKYDKIKSIRKINASIPDWLDTLGMEELPDRWEKELAFLNKPAEVVIRANTIKTTRDQLFHQLNEIGIATSKNNQFPDALFLDQRQNIFSNPLFLSGMYEVQDASSQLVAPALQVEPGMRVVDACAGAGGKALHLAALMKNKGRIIAMDTEERKLISLKKRAKRAGISIIETRLIESSKTIKRMHDSADRLLLDVPCSGLGVLRRNPDAKWKLTQDFINSIQVTQQKIISEYAPILKGDGSLVYSTCSILPSENNLQIKKFMETRMDTFQVENETNLFPSTGGFDGFFIARLKRLK